MTQGLLYWKHTPDMTDYHSEGYAGITKRGLEVRNAEHEHDAYVRNSLLRVHEMMRLHKGNIKTSIIFEGDYNECLDYEEELRPRWHIGWNMAIGGGRPGSGWKPNPLWLDNRLWHPKHGEETVSNTNTLSNLSKKYETSHAVFSEILLGQRPISKEWELANSQLMHRVKDRHDSRWSHVYIMKDNVIVSVHKTGQHSFAKHLGFKNCAAIPLQSLHNGSHRSVRKWELATEEEWLATKERIEFK